MASLVNLPPSGTMMYIMCCTLNEVGGHPDQFKTSVAAFHHANEQRVRRTPHAMLSTSTYDTKRGEDTRARPALLGEAAEEWIQHVTAWSRILRARSSGSGDSAPPERNDEYEFYQLLFGAWPPELSTGGKCQKQSASAFGMSLEVKRADFRITQGKARSWSRGTDSGNRLKCSFCPRCGSRIWHQSDPAFNTVTVKAGSLDQSVDASDATHIWTSRAVTGIVIPAAAVKFPEEPL
jgi:hypothetical protein